MTKNEPEFVNPAAKPVQLCFFYDYAANEISSSSSPLNAFFDTSLDPGQQPPFLGAFEGTDADLLIVEWRSCLQLKENETRNFTIAATSRGTPFLFSFLVMRPASSFLINPSLLTISVTRTISNFPSTAENKKSSSLSTEYTEFIELAVHDLDSPLRKLSVLIERIAGRYENVTDTDTKGYILRTRACLSDMRSLIENLSLLARLSNLQSKKVPCDLESIIQTLLKNWNGLHVGNKIVMIPGSLPVVEGDITQYRQLFNSLLENTFKFTKKGTPAEVEIFSEVASDEEKQSHNLPAGHTYFKIIIADKGIGFKQDHAEKIFQPFVRLNGKSEYTGSGIGLAICKKIVENHCGIIYAESEENFGARFTLFLPLSPY